MVLAGHHQASGGCPEGLVLYCLESCPAGGANDGRPDGGPVLQSAAYYCLISDKEGLLVLAPGRSCKGLQGVDFAFRFLDCFLDVVTKSVHRVEENSEEFRRFD